MSSERDSGENGKRIGEESRSKLKADLGVVPEVLIQSPFVRSVSLKLLQRSSRSVNR